MFKLSTARSLFISISERIFLILEKQGKRQSDLVKLLNVRPTTVSEWKKGKREPSGSYYAKIAEYLGVSLDYLIAGREPPSVPVQQIIGDRNTNNTVMFTGGGAVNLSEYERELLKLCAAFDMRQKNALLSYAYDLEKQTKRED